MSDDTTKNDDVLENEDEKGSLAEESSEEVVVNVKATEDLSEASEEEEVVVIVPGEPEGAAEADSSAEVDAAFVGDYPSDAEDVGDESSAADDSDDALEMPGIADVDEDERRDVLDEEDVLLTATNDARKDDHKHPVRAESAERAEDAEDYEDIYHVDGIAAYFDYPGELLVAAAHVRDSDFESWDAYSPFPIHGIEDAMGTGRSWLPWITFLAGATGFILANLLQFGALTFDWPMIIGGKPHAPWPSFVPIMFELTVLIGGVTTAFVMFVASGCFRKPKIIDTQITNDRFLIWIDAKDPHFAHARTFLEGLNPVEIRDVVFEG